MYLYLLVFLYAFSSLSHASEQLNIDVLIPEEALDESDLPVQTEVCQPASFKKKLYSQLRSRITLAAATFSLYATAGMVNLCGMSMALHVDEVSGKALHASSYAAISALIRFFENEVQVITSGSWIWLLFQKVSKKRLLEMAGLVAGFVAIFAVEIGYVSAAESLSQYLQGEVIQTEHSDHAMEAAFSFILPELAIALRTKKLKHKVNRTFEETLTEDTKNVLKEYIQDKGNWAAFRFGALHTVANIAYNESPTLVSNLFFLMMAGGVIQLFRDISMSEEAIKGKIKTILSRLSLEKNSTRPRGKIRGKCRAFFGY